MRADRDWPSKPGNERDRAACPSVGRREWKGQHAERFHGNTFSGRADDGLIVGSQQSARDARESGEGRTERDSSNGDPRALRVRPAKEPPAGEKRDHDHGAKSHVVPPGMIDRLPRQQNFKSHRTNDDQRGREHSDQRIRTSGATADSIWAKVGAPS